MCQAVTSSQRLRHVEKKEKRKKNTHTQQKVSDAADPGIKCRSSLGWQAGRAALAATVGEWRWWGVGWVQLKDPVTQIVSTQ